jgi:hypothetical protein
VTDTVSMTFDPLSIPALPPGEYERLLQKGQAAERQFQKLPALIPVKVTNYGRKVSLAMNAIKAERWEDLPGWADWDHLRIWHEKRWPFDSPCPEIIKGNEEHHHFALKIRKDDLNVLSYAWNAAHYEHFVRFQKYATNPRWAGFLLDVVAAHDLAVAGQLEMWLRDMRITVERQP